MFNFEAQNKAVSNEPRRKRYAATALAVLSIVTATPAFGQERSSYIRERLSDIQTEETAIMSGYNSGIEQMESNVNSHITGWLAWSGGDLLRGVNPNVVTQLLARVPNIDRYCRLEHNYPAGLNGFQLLNPSGTPAGDVNMGVVPSSVTVQMVAQTAREFGDVCTQVRQRGYDIQPELTRLEAERHQLEAELASEGGN